MNGRKEKLSPHPQHQGAIISAITWISCYRLQEECRSLPTARWVEAPPLHPSGCFPASPCQPMLHAWILCCVIQGQCRRLVGPWYGFSSVRVVPTGGLVPDGKD